MITTIAAHDPLVTLLMRLQADLQIAPGEPVLIDEVGGTIVSILAVTARDLGARPATATIVYGSGGPIWTELISATVLEALVAKVKGNVTSLPPLRFLQQVRQRRGGGRRGELRPLRASRWPALLAASAVSRLMVPAALVGKAKTRAVRVSELAEWEVELLQRLQTWRVIQGQARLDAFWTSLDEWMLALQLTLVGNVYVNRFLEDVEGMCGVHMSSAVATAAVIANRGIGQAVAAFHGAMRTSEDALLSWSARADPQLHEDLLRGFFPDPDQMDAHLHWLRAAVARWRDWLQRHWVPRLVMPLVGRSIPSDTSATNQRSLPDGDYRIRKPPATVAEVDRLLRDYATSVEALLEMIQAPADGSVRLVGSLAEGHGHPRSDIDLVVLLRTTHVGSLPGVSTTAGHSEVAVGKTPTNTHVAVDFLTDASLATLRDWQDENARALDVLAADRPQPLDRIVPALGRLRAIHAQGRLAKLFQRAMFGVVLRDGDASTPWRDTLSVPLFASALVFAHYTEYRALWRRVELSPTPRTPGVMLIARAACVELLLAYLAGRGRFLLRRRWLLPAIAELDDPTLLAFARRAIFPRPTDVESYLDWLALESTRLTSRLESPHGDVRTASASWEAHLHVQA
jgi:hypothetical protein